MFETLDITVKESLQLHQEIPSTTLNFPKDKRVLVIASGNALPTGRVLMDGYDATFVDEGGYKELTPDRLKIYANALVLSASGEKHAPIIVKDMQKAGLNVTLMTCTPTSSAAKLVAPSNLIVTKSRPEPITYNTSTYMGMMLVRTRENTKTIAEYINSTVAPLLKNLEDYTAFYLLLPDKYAVLREMLVTKFDELFGPRLIGRCYTFSQTLHAKTVIPSTEELFISFGVQNDYFGPAKLHIPAPQNAGVVSMMAISYYTVGMIQNAFPAWFEHHCDEYKRIQKALPF